VNSLPSSNKKFYQRRKLWQYGYYVARIAALLGLILPLCAVALYRWVPVPVTPLMLGRTLAGADLHKEWVGFEDIPPSLYRLLIASEDGRFCQHQGFDWQAIKAALAHNRQTGRRILRGGSSISQQTAKNLLLWPARSWLRKGIESYITILLESLWSKQRIITVYLNIVEFGPGIYGVEAAAQYFFAKPAQSLTLEQAARLIAVLPNPHRYSVVKPTAYVKARARILQKRVGQLAPEWLDCLD
jgi:monofunctional glycosyltransferase